MNGKEISELESGTPSDESKLIIIDPNGTPKQAELGTIKELIGVTRTEWETKNAELEGEITTESGTRSAADETLQGNIDTLENSIIGDSATVQVKSAETADKATGDEDGNNIKTTYAPLASAALTGSPTVNGNAIVGSGTLEENKPVIFDGTKLVSSDTVLPVVDNLESESASSALSANQGRVLDGKISTNASAISTLEANMFGNGTATIYNTADTDAGQSAGAVVVTLTNYPSVTTLQEGARFRVVMGNDATFESDDDNKYQMSVNGGTAYPVTIGNVEAGIGWAQSGKSYEFVFTGSSYDCLSNDFRNYIIGGTLTAVYTSTLYLWKSISLPTRFKNLTSDKYSVTLTSLTDEISTSQSKLFITKYTGRFTVYVRNDTVAWSSTSTQKFDYHIIINP